MITENQIRELKDLYLKDVKFGDLKEKFGLNNAQMFFVDFALNVRSGKPLFPDETALLDILPHLTDKMKSYEIVEFVNRLVGGEK